jgi:exopolysaccharide biosynthesis predicted pyruvyltransferase EpsI
MVPRLVTAGPSPRHRAALEEVRAHLETTLAPLLPAGPVAILDFQDSHNPGDAAIWVGAHRLVRRLGGRVTYVATLASFDAERCRRATDGGVVVLAGGGNFGDVWPAHQRHREAVFTALRDRPVVQLPQSLELRSDAARERARRAVAGHPDLHLLFRDRRSWETARDLFDANVVLSPDMAFELTDLPHGPATHDLLAVARDDRERGDDLRSAALARGIEVMDWPGDRWQPRARTLAVFAATRMLGRADRSLAASRRLTAPRVPLYLAAATRRVMRASTLLSARHAVVTDRLHGHILCELLGVPHVALDPPNGKVSTLHDTWLSWSPTRVERTAPAACDAALELARSAAER